MALVAELFDHVVGIDTHARTHTYCIVQCATGAIVDNACFPTSKAGMTRAITWIRKRTSDRTLAAVEGTSSYGAGITHSLIENGFEVVAVRPAARTTHAQAGKSDALDAKAAARSVIGLDLERVARPRRTGDRTALRVLLASRSIIDQQRTANRNALTALLRTIDLGVDARRPLTNTQIRTVAAWRTGGATGPKELLVARREARRLAATVIEQTRLLDENHRELGALAATAAPGLQDEPGIGPVTAAIIVCAYSHRGRVRSEAAFAALGGVAPLPASSGNTTRHRLSRSGDRQLNRALDIIVRTRMSFDPDTRNYIERRTAQGKTKREIRRCLKRYVSRSVYRQLQTCIT